MKHELINLMEKILLQLIPITDFVQFLLLSRILPIIQYPGILSREFCAGDFKPGISEMKSPANWGDFTTVIP